MADETYDVEKILDKRIKNGELQFLVKWKGYDMIYNSWEPIINFTAGCLVFVEEYEVRANADKKTRGRPKKRKLLDSSDQLDSCELFENDLIADKILGATKNQDGEVQFLMKWKNSDVPELILGKEAAHKCPLLVIKFYEERLSWSDNNKKDDKTNNSQL